jgi:hypothetical protein
VARIEYRPFAGATKVTRESSTCGATSSFSAICAPADDFTTR